MEASRSSSVGFDFQPRTRVVFGDGSLGRLGELARDLRFTRTMLVADQGLLRAGHVQEATTILRRCGIDVIPYHDFDVNPDSQMVARGAAYAEASTIDSLIGLGGGSSLDCAKGINFVVTNGGTIANYRGYGRATRPMLPMIGVPTTAGTGSEAQSYALISDEVTHEKMACGDPKAAFRVALLDPRLTISQPPEVTSATGLDAIAHALETYVTTRRSHLSDMFAREGWRLLESHFERVLTQPDDLDARAAMQLGAHCAGAAIEQSMLGATHACANPLTAGYGTTHGVAIALLLPHVVRWNSPVVTSRYHELLSIAGRSANGDPGLILAERLHDLARSAGLPQTLRDIGVSRSDLPALAAEAADQWTGRFNPRLFDREAAREIYEQAY